MTTIIPDDLPLALNNGEQPLRLALTGEDGFPHIACLWYQFAGGAFYCVTHKSAWILQQLRANDRVGFDISTNTPPYKGIRGTGNATLSPLQGELFEQIISSYLGSTESKFAQWLLSRKKDEVVIKITPRTISTWDFSQRMGESPPHKDSATQQ